MTDKARDDGVAPMRAANDNDVIDSAEKEGSNEQVLRNERRKNIHGNGSRHEKVSEREQQTHRTDDDTDSTSLSARTVSGGDLEATPQMDEKTVDVPPDGGYGWVCVACVFLINGHTWGLNSVCLYPPPKDISLINSRPMVSF